MTSSLVDELTFISYASNRDAAPHITPERWAPHYPNAAELEARYQAERAIGKARAQAEIDDAFRGLA